MSSPRSATVARPDGQARVIFLVARISDDGSLVENINTRYIVESVEIHGDSGRRHQPVRCAIGCRRWWANGSTTMKPTSSDDLLEAERPGYDRQAAHLARQRARPHPRRLRVQREGGHAVDSVHAVAIEVRLSLRAGLERRARHSDGWPEPSRHRRIRFSNNDDLVEEYSGVRVAFESRKLATDRLGASIEIARFNNTWRDPTLFALAADPTIPEPYRTRLTVEPSVTFAPTPYVRVTGGVSLSELESLMQPPDSQNANAVVTRIDYGQRWYRGRRRHAARRSELRAADVRRGARERSDLQAAPRHVRYRYSQRHNTVIGNVAFGGITGDAPLFERFTLGDTATLRGWNKFDIAPAGGDRVFHSRSSIATAPSARSSTPARCGTSNGEMRFRLSTGFGVQTRQRLSDARVSAERR